MTSNRGVTHSDHWLYADSVQSSTTLLCKRVKQRNTQDSGCAGDRLGD